MGDTVIVGVEELSKESGMTVAGVAAVLKGLSVDGTVEAMKMVAGAKKAKGLVGVSEGLAVVFRQWVAYQMGRTLEGETEMAKSVLDLLQNEGPTELVMLKEMMAKGGLGATKQKHVLGLLGLPRWAKEGVWPPVWMVEAPRVGGI